MKIEKFKSGKKQKTAYEIMPSLVGSEMCIRDSLLLSGILSTVFNVIGIVIGVMLGEIEYVALFLVLAFSLNFIQANILLMKVMFKSTLFEFLSVLKKPFIMAVMQAIVFYFLPDLNFSIFINLLIKGSLFLVVWLVGLLMTCLLYTSPSPRD